MAAQGEGRGRKDNFAASVREIMPVAPSGSAPVLDGIEQYYLNEYMFHQQVFS